MITITDLQTSLLDLLHEVEGADIRVIVGGGFGIYLKSDHVRRRGLRTFFTLSLSGGVASGFSPRKATPWSRPPTSDPGVKAMTLVSASNFDPGIGKFGLVSISYTATVSDPNLGAPLNIVLGGTGTNALQANFDNVRLEASPTVVPLPGAALLLGSGLVGLAGLRRKFRR